jgi:hypothetical protein
MLNGASFGGAMNIYFGLPMRGMGTGFMKKGSFQTLNDIQMKQQPLIRTNGFVGSKRNMVIMLWNDDAEFDNLPFKKRDN